MRLEPQMWNAIEEIAAREGVTINNLCTQIDKKRADLAVTVGLTSATRVFIIAYFRRLFWQYERNSSVKTHGIQKKNDRLRRTSIAVWALEKVVSDHESDSQEVTPD